MKKNGPVVNCQHSASSSPFADFVKITSSLNSSAPTAVSERMPVPSASLSSSAQPPLLFFTHLYLSVSFAKSLWKKYVFSTPRTAFRFSVLVVTSMRIGTSTKS